MSKLTNTAIAVALFGLRRRLDAIRGLTANIAVRKEVGLVCDELLELATGISEGLDEFCKSCHQNLVDESETKCPECLLSEAEAREER